MGGEMSQLTLTNHVYTKTYTKDEVERQAKASFFSSIDVSKSHSEEITQAFKSNS